MTALHNNDNVTGHNTMAIGAIAIRIIAVMIFFATSLILLIIFFHSVFLSPTLFM